MTTTAGVVMGLKVEICHFVASLRSQGSESNPLSTVKGLQLVEIGNPKATTKHARAKIESEVDCLLSKVMLSQQNNEISRSILDMWRGL